MNRQEARRESARREEAEYNTQERNRIRLAKERAVERYDIDTLEKIARATSLNRFLIRDEDY